MSFQLYCFTILSLLLAYSWRQKMDGVHSMESVYVFNMLWYVLYSSTWIFI